MPTETKHKRFRFKVKPSTHPELYWLTHLTPEQANRKDPLELFYFLPDELQEIIWDYYSVNILLFKKYAAVLSMEIQHKEIQRLVSIHEIKIHKENLSSLSTTTQRTTNNWRMAFTNPSIHMEKTKQKFTKLYQKNLEIIYSKCLTHAKEGLTGEKDWFWDWSNKGLFRDKYNPVWSGICSVCYPDWDLDWVPGRPYPIHLFSHDEFAKIYCSNCLGSDMYKAVGVGSPSWRRVEWTMGTTYNPNIVSTLVWKSTNPYWKTGRSDLMCDDNTLTFDKHDIKKWLDLYDSTWMEISNLLNN